MILSCPEGTRAVVFVGPSLAADRVRALTPPDTVIAPPVRFGDLYALIGSRVETVLIIDGVFHGDTPVWQREILAAMQAGIRVVGAASMGALRALELAPYGMLGPGTVVAWYRDGKIEGDDEVALLHAGAEMGYRSLSLPLVDIRFALEAAVSRDELPTREVQVLLGRLKSLAHADRTLRRIMAEAESAGLDNSVIGTLLGPGRTSVKADDAELALRALGQPGLLETLSEVGTGALWNLPPLPAREEATLLRAGFAPRGGAIRIGDVLIRSTSNADETARRRREASRRWFLSDWSERRGIGPTQDEVQALADALLAQRAQAAACDADRWLRASALIRADLPGILHGLAVERWLLRVGARGAGLPQDDSGASPIPLALLDWAEAWGVRPPETLDGPDARAAWIVQSGPIHFGFPEWSPDAAIAQMLQIEGVVAASVLAEESAGALMDAG